MKKSAFILILLFSLLVNYNFANAQEGEQIAASGNDIVKSIEEKEIMWGDMFKMLKTSLREQNDFINNQKSELIKKKAAANEFLKNPPDSTGFFKASYVGAEQWEPANNQENKIKSFLNDQLTDAIDNDRKDVNDQTLNKTKKIKERISEKEDFLTNSATIFGALTYEEAKGEENGNTGAVSVDNTEKVVEKDELKNALLFTDLIVNPYNSGRLSKEKLKSSEMGAYKEHSDYLSKTARKSLASQAFLDSVVARTNVKQAGLGRYIKEYIKLLKNTTEGTDLSSLNEEDIPDDISKYEFMDIMFSKILIDPAWYVLLDSMPTGDETLKPLHQIQTQLRAFITTIDWENAKMLEKLTAISAAELAISAE